MKTGTIRTIGSSIREEPSAAEDLKRIPVLRREDISREIVLDLYNEVLDFTARRCYHEIETNGITICGFIVRIFGQSIRRDASVVCSGSVVVVRDHWTRK